MKTDGNKTDRQPIAHTCRNSCIHLYVYRLPVHVVEEDKDVSKNACCLKNLTANDLGIADKIQLSVTSTSSTTGFEVLEINLNTIYKAAVL